MHEQTPLLHRRRLLPALLLLAACSSGEEAAPPQQPRLAGALQRLEVEPLGTLTIPGGTTGLEAPAARDMRTWGALGVEGAVDQWDFSGTRTQYLQLEGRPVLVVHREEPTRLYIPASLSLRDTPQITFELVVRNQGFKIRGELVGGGEVLSEAELQIIKSKGFQTLRMTFPAVQGEAIEVDRIVLDIPPGELPLGLVSVSIEDVPLGGTLPLEAFGGWTLVEIGSDARRGTCLSTEAGARTSFEVTGEDQELAFSHATPRSIIRAGEPPVLEMRLVSEEGDRVDMDLPFAGSLESPPNWKEVRVTVGHLVGQAVEVEFRVRSPDGSPRLGVLGQPQLVARRPEPATVLLVSSDTHRADHLGFVAGEEGPRTEWLDKLAENGVAFLDATSSINNTTPSHVALFTGLSPRDTGIVANATRLADTAPTLAERFAEQGYATLAAVSAAPVCSQFSGLGQGFDRYSNPGYRSARDSAETLEQLMAWLPDYEGRPLFVWLHVYDAHSPYEAPDELLHLYYPEDLKPRDPGSPVADYDLAPDWDPTIADPVYTESAYKAEVSYVDRRLSELLELERFWAGTIAFTSDHGETLRDGGEYRFSHRDLSPSTIAVPLIFKAPGLPGGERREEPVRQIDVGRTLLDLAGHVGVDFPGRNVLEGGGEKGGVRFSIQANGYSAAALTDEWMLRLALRRGRAELHAVGLYHVPSDEACRNDRSAEEPELTARLRAELVAWLVAAERRSWDEAARGDADVVQRQLAELGYVGGEEAGDAPAAAWIDPDCACANCAAFR